MTVEGWRHDGHEAAAAACGRRRRKGDWGRGAVATATSS